jgi:preprotein translocase subunit SecE
VSRIQRFVQDSWQELKKVNWPTPQQARNLTILVLVISTAVALYIAAFDTLFGIIAKDLLRAG